MEQEIFEVGRNLKKGLEENHKFEQVSTAAFHDKPEVMRKLMSLIRRGKTKVSAAWIIFVVFIFAFL